MLIYSSSHLPWLWYFVIFLSDLRCGWLSLALLVLLGVDLGVVARNR